MQLSETQATFLSDIAYSSGEIAPEKTGRGSQARMRVYRRNYTNNHYHALADTYKSVHITVGVHYFKTIAMEYIAKHPSTSGDLNDYGQEFSEFLKFKAMNGKVIDKLPYLADLAQLDWYTLLSLRAPKKQTPLSELLHLPPEQLELARFHLNPASFIVKSIFPIYDIWRLANGENISVDLHTGAQNALVTRIGSEVRVMSIGEVETNLIEQWYRGASFGASLTQLARLYPGTNIGNLISKMSGLNVIGEIV